MKVLRWVLLLLVAPWVLMWLAAGPVDSDKRVDEAARTRYPIVLVHGMAGFDDIGSSNYFRGVPERLRAHGATVWVVPVSAFNSSDVRGQQLLAALEQRMKAEKVDKVNLIGHSHGSHTSRFVAGVRPDLVASVTSVSGPNQGSAMADWLARKDVEHPQIVGAVLATGSGLGRLIDWLSGTHLPQDARAVMGSLTTAGAADFNKRFPAGIPQDACGEGEAEVKGVRYYSWSGVGSFYRALNPADYAMAATSLPFASGVANDGLVSKCSSHLGQVIRDDYPLNHLHSVNMFFGLVDSTVDPVQLYLEHAQRLKAAGL